MRINDGNIFHLITGVGSVEGALKGPIKLLLASSGGLLDDALNFDSVLDLVHLFLEAIGLLLELGNIISVEGDRDRFDERKGSAAARALIA